MNDAVGIIPARLGSTRFPGKVLAAETGRPLIQHVYEAAKKAASLARVVVATDDERVAAAVRSFGGECVLTRTDHPNGTSRLAEAAAKLGLSDDQIIVNVQGDEPELDPATIDASVKALVDGEVARGRWTTRDGPGAAHGSSAAVALFSGVAVATAAAPFTTVEQAADPNCVKVVRALDGTALYFSRAQIPFDRDRVAASPSVWLRHVGIYVYRTAFLRAYAALPSTQLEKLEQLEQLRVLEHGGQIAVALVERAHAGIDTPEQYAAFVERWRSNHAAR